MFGSQMLRIGISSWWMFPLINMECAYLSLAVSFGLKIILSDIKMAILVCFFSPFT